MEDIKQHLDQAEQKLHKEWQEKEDRIRDEIKQTKSEITDLAETAGPDFDGIFRTHPSQPLINQGLLLLPVL